MTGIPKEALLEYIAETREMCDRVSLCLGKVEKNQYDDETLNSLYRNMHSIKGGAHLFGFRFVGQLAHAMETALEPVRQKMIQLDSGLVDALFDGLDLLTRLLIHIEEKGQEDPVEAKQLDAIIARVAGLAIDAIKLSRTSQASRVVEDKPIDNESPQGKANEEISLAQAELELALNKVKTSSPATGRGDVHYIKESQSFVREESASDVSTVRVPVGLLDNLMNLVGELVLVRNQVLQFRSQDVNSDFQKLSQRLNVVTAELQTDVMKTRMQPIGPFLTKFHRVVRDLARDLGKMVELKIEGADTELDKTLIEAVKDPLTHLIRNCVDHGMELPEGRKVAGKSPIGSIIVRSYHEGGHVIVEVSDNGPGISPTKIAKKALERGIITNEQLATMSSRDVRHLIFTPGFSTADVVTDISGRGVGMDVVKTNIEKIGGTIDLDSTEGVGTTVRLNIPLTLAIIPALLVTSGGARFAIPQVKVQELLRVDGQSRGDLSLLKLQGQAMVNLRGNLMPVVRLKNLLVSERSHAGFDFSEVKTIVVLRNESITFCLAVDEVLDNVDIVVKPLAHSIRNIMAYSGATVMGDGVVVLILDVGGLARLGNVSSGLPKQSFESLIDAQTRHPDAADYLVADLGVGRGFAMPLCLVNRLEEFLGKDVQYSGKIPVLRYRGGLLPIIPIGVALDLMPGSAEDWLTVDRFSIIVVSKSNRLFGLAVRKVEDIISVHSDIDGEISDRPGILGSLVRGDNVLVVLDVLKIIDDYVSKNAGSQVLPRAVHGGEWTRANTTGRVTDRPGMRSLKIILVEDTSFFRRQVSAYLAAQGHQVVTVVNGEEAFNRLQAGGASGFDLVVTDIEMPIMDGFELTKRIRSSTALSELPVIALTTRFRDADIKMGRDVGFNAYLEKFNGDALMQTVDRIFGPQSA